MTKEQYIKMTEPVRSNPKLAHMLHILNRLFTGIEYVCYPLLLGYLAWNRKPELAQAIIVPLDGFIILSVFRYFINARRPYEVFEMPPIIPKKTKGKSFPSRHVFCAVLIGMTFLFVAPYLWMGICLLIVGVLLAVVRVITGVHFPRDVIAGMLCGVVAGLFFLLF